MDLYEKNGNILYILNVLKKYSDEDHQLSAAEIGRKVKETYDVEIDPRTIRRNINLLKYKLNYDISTSIINSSRASKWKKCRYRNNIITIYKSNARK